MNDENLTSQETHFDFGRNWAAYAEKITSAEIQGAERGLARLLGDDRLDGRRVLDIGSGSGLHSLAALRLGAREVVAVDIDPDSVATTRAVLARHAPEGNWRVEQRSVFELDPDRFGRFELVYSWGVLHHTGDLARAIRCAASLIDGGGEAIFAFYRRTWMDWFWRLEKRWYTQAGEAMRVRAQAVFVRLFRLALLLTGRSFEQYVGAYRDRGMDFYHDVHDWMGGWPYESISSVEVETAMRGLGFSRVRAFVRPNRQLGMFGSGCDEYVYRRDAL